MDWQRHYSSVLLYCSSAMTAVWKDLAARLLFGCCFLELCVAPNVKCTVTRGADQTTYSVPDSDAPDCEFSWANHNVLGNHEQKDARVNISTFTSSECFPWINYSRSCILEHFEYTASCTTNCSGIVPSPKDKATEGSLSWIAGVIIPVPLLLICYLGYKYRCEILKWLQKTYTPVMKVDLEAAEEADNSISL